jgi:cation:H+ antiporter
MTVVAFGTSVPELVVSMDAAIKGSPDIAVGNIIGSNIANLLLIIGVSGMVMPIAARPRPLILDTIVLVGATSFFAVLVWQGTIGRTAGMMLLAMLCVFLGSSYWREVRGNGGLAAETLKQEAAEIEEMPGSLWAIWAAVIAGLASVIVGAEILVDGGVSIARSVGISEAVIGLSLIAVGTSLPELAASVMAAIRGHSDIAVGNVVGSNLFNMLCVAGAVSAITPLPVAPQIQTFDVWVMLGATVMFVPFLVAKIRFGRTMGAIFLGLYAAYIAALLAKPENVFSFLG